MVKMLTHRMTDSLSCMLQAKEELQANLHARGAVEQGMKVSEQLMKMEDSELAKENAQLRRQLLEAAADNDAISKSLHEQAQILADITDAKINAESEAKILQVQMKSVQKDMDVHKYELHLLRKQLQIRDDEREQNKKVADASHKKHLENVKKIARLESECQRLRGLIRQRLPGPAVVAQMRAECEMHISMGKKRPPSLPPSSSRNSPSSPYLQYQREIDALTERLLSVEDEAKFLKEAMARRTAELQEARQLCARTAMKLSSAQNLIEAMSIGSVPSTPQPRTYIPLFNMDQHQALVDQEKSTMCANYSKDEEGMDATIDVNSENIEGSCNNGELDELSCAESWASALIAELSQLSHLNDNASVTTTENLRTSNNIEAFNCCKQGATFQELDFQRALEKVSQKLSYVGESLLLSRLGTSNDQVNHEELSSACICGTNFCVHASANNGGAIDIDQHVNILCNATTSYDINGIVTDVDQHDVNTLCSRAATNNGVVIEIDQHVNILEEILETKGLLLELGRAILEMKSKGSLMQEEEDIAGKVVGDHVAAVRHVHDEEISDEVGANGQSERPTVSRSQSMEDGGISMIQISAADSNLSETTIPMTDKMEDFSEKTMKFSAGGTTICENSNNFNHEMEDFNDKMEDFGDSCKKMISVAATKSSCGILSEKPNTSRVILENSYDGMIQDSTAAAKCSANSSTSSLLSCSLVLQPNSAGETSDVAPDVEQPPLQVDEITHLPSQLDAHVALESLLQAAQAELELSRGKITTLEGELSRVLQEKADVANDLSATRSIKDNLEAELACAHAILEELKVQVSSLKSELADRAQHGSTMAHSNGPNSTQSSDVIEEQDLAAARAQLADCQRSIHAMRKQLASDIMHSTSQDVIIDELASFDSSSESSKSMDQKSHSSSPIIKKLPNCDKFSSKLINMKPMEYNAVNLINHEGNISHHIISCNTNPLQEKKTSHSILSNTQELEEMETFEKGIVYDVEDSSLPCNLLTKSISKASAIKPIHHLQEAKPPKSSTTARIVEFFNRAKSTTKSSGKSLI